MLYREAIAEIKETICSLTEQQIKDKNELRQPHTAGTWSTMSSAFIRAGKITLYLNMYNKIRNKGIQHSTDKYDDCWSLRNTKSEFKKYEDVIHESQVVTVD